MLSLHLILALQVASLYHVTHDDYLYSYISGLRLLVTPNPMTGTEEV